MVYLRKIFFPASKIWDEQAGVKALASLARSELAKRVAMAPKWVFFFHALLWWPSQNQGGRSARPDRRCVISKFL
jgi:hypothetical protein